MNLLNDALDLRLNHRNLVLLHRWNHVTPIHQRLSHLIGLPEDGALCSPLSSRTLNLGADEIVDRLLSVLLLLVISNDLLSLSFFGNRCYFFISSRLPLF